MMAGEEGCSLFGPTFIIEPGTTHTHTAVMLHGRGSNGPEFADELSETVSPGQTNLIQRFPGWRWVFLSSKTLWSTMFEEDLPAWFEAHSLTDTEERQDLQVEGIQESVDYIKSIVDQEVEKLGGDRQKIVLAGISQGGAIGMWALLTPENLDSRFGAFVAASTWLPFANTIETFLDRGGVVQEVSQADCEPGTFVRAMMSSWRCHPEFAKGSMDLLSTPIFLGHGTDDATVNVELGREATRVLSKIGFREPSNTEQFRHSVSSSWARFLNAAQSSQELGGLKRSLDDHIRQTSSSIGSLHKEVAHRHELATISAVETKSRTEQIASELKEVASLRTDIASLREDTIKSNVEISERFEANQQMLQTLLTGASQAAKAEIVESLQTEIRELRAEKLKAEKKLAALERQVAAEQKLAEEKLEETRNQLAALERQTETDKADLNGQLLDLGQQPKPKRTSPSGSDQAHFDRNSEEYKELKDLYHAYREAYRANPPKSDVAFIWRFISNIEDPKVSKHVQESLLKALPEYVVELRGSSRHKQEPKKKRYISIAKGVTWRMFREALVYHPPQN
ncbi:Alpha/Beta hydrolase protein [Cladorrhinum sp. PSN332]|nr:Alpha/Beta hydrolase protein [Cladorrhinum sp. PSN332]